MSYFNLLLVPSVSSTQILLLWYGFSLLQLDANLIEGEPYNRLAQLKIKDD